MRTDSRIKHCATAAAIIVFSTLSACTTTATGNPSPDPGNGASTSETSQGTGIIPEIGTPLEAETFITDPCASLTASQLGEFGAVGPGEKNATGSTAELAGPWCFWLVPDVGGALSVGFVDVKEGGMRNIYAAENKYAYFEPTTASDYPAVFFGDPDRREDGNCNIMVGISDSTAFRVTEDGSLGKDGSCARAREVATAVIDTIRAGN